jgi:hypothetical protein
MHVLLPAAAAGHVPVLLYPDSAQMPNQAETTTPGTWELRNGSLDLRRDLVVVSGQTLDNVPGGVAEIEASTGKVDHSLVDTPDTHGHVISRISFAAGKASHTTGGKGAVWKLGGKSQQLAIRLVWTLDVEGDSVTLHHRGMNGQGDGEPLTLYPSDKGVLKLWVFHSPSDQLPNKLPPCTRKPSSPPMAMHYRAYYDLITPPVSNPEIPTFEAFDLTQRLCDDESLRGTEVTCVVAKATLQE